MGRNSEESLVYHERVEERGEIGESEEAKKAR